LSAPAIVHDAERQWKILHREMVTASDAGAIIGVDPRRGELAVWAVKVGEIEVEETIPMRRGRRLESAIVEEYGEQTGRVVTPWPPFEILRHPTITFLGATLDATTIFDAQRIPLEIKLALGSAADWREEAPVVYQCQAQVQAQCFGAPVAALAGLIGPGPLKTYDLARDDAFFATLVPRLEKFMWHVRNRVPPEADGKPGTTAAVRLMWPGASGETAALAQEDTRTMDDLESARARVSAAKHTERELLNRLHARMAGASFGALPDGSFVKRTRVECDAYEVAEKDYVTLRRWWPRYRRR
jgi:putative phage-type endonuclease